MAEYRVEEAGLSFTIDTKYYNQLDIEGFSHMIQWDGKDKELLALLRYMAEEDKLEKVLAHPQVIKTPVVRNGKQATLGYQPEVWKGWLTNGGNV